MTQHEDTLFIPLLEGANAATFIPAYGLAERDAIVYTSAKKSEPPGSHKRAPSAIATTVELPPGKWKLIGLHSKEQPLTEEMWAQVVEKSSSGNNFKDYDRVAANKNLDKICITATESGLSLLKKLGLAEEKVLAVLIRSA